MNRHICIILFQRSAYVGMLTWLNQNMSKKVGLDMGGVDIGDRKEGASEMC